MSRAEFVCPICRASVLAPASLAGASAPCPKCRADVPRWPEPRQKPVSAPPAPAPMPAPVHSYSPNSGTAVPSESDGAAAAMIEKHGPAVNFTALIGAAVLFLLPWTNIHCNGRQLGTQTGLQAVIGDVTPAENIKHFQLGETKNATPNPDKEIRPALLVGLAGLLTLAGAAMAARPLFSLRASSVRPELLAAVALGLLLIQSAVGFPVNDTLFKNRKGTDGRTPESEVASLAVDLRADRTVWFYFALCFLAVPTGLYAYRLATSANVSRWRSAAAETYTPRSTAGAADFNDAQRLLLKRTALVVGGLFLVLLASVLLIVVQRSDALRTGTKDGDLRPGERQVRDREEWNRLPDDARAVTSGTITNIQNRTFDTAVAIKLDDGLYIWCHFGDLFGEADGPRGSDLRDWIAGLQFGQRITVRGRVTRNPPALHDCDTLPPIKRVR